MAQKVLVEMLLRDSVFPKLVALCSAHQGVWVLVSVVLKFYFFIFLLAEEKGNTYVFKVEGFL